MDTFPHIQPLQAALPFPNIDPVAISLGPLAVHWYGLAYVAGILLAWWFVRKLVTTPRLWQPHPSPITKIDADDLVTWIVIGIVAGGRLGYVLFYNAGYYLTNPLGIFAIWDGGMSFHGGALGSIVAMVLFARSRGFQPFSLLDVVAVGSCFGLFFGRLANFINSELWGRTTDVPWAFVFPTGGPEPRHPSQLYEAGLEGVVLFAVLCWLIYARGKARRARLRRRRMGVRLRAGAHFRGILPRAGRATRLPRLRLADDGHAVVAAHAGHRRMGHGDRFQPHALSQ